jgi:hypothetical protein
MEIWVGGGGEEVWRKLFNDQRIYKIVSLEMIHAVCFYTSYIRIMLGMFSRKLWLIVSLALTA